MRRLLSSLFLLASMLVSTAAFALDTTMTDLFTAANITGLNNNVGTLLTGFIGIGLLFTGYRYLKKSGIK